MEDFIDFIKERGYVFVCAAFAEYYAKQLFQNFLISIDPGPRNYEMRLMRGNVMYFSYTFDYKKGYQDFITKENEFIETVKNIIKINMENDIKKDFKWVVVMKAI